jgi:hypothetical protein
MKQFGMTKEEFTLEGFEGFVISYYKLLSKLGKAHDNIKLHLEFESGHTGIARLMPLQDFAVFRLLFEDGNQFDHLPPKTQILVTMY